MKCASRPGAGATQFRSGAKPFLSILLSVVFVFPTGIALPTPTAAAAAKDKKPKQEPALKGLPITELSADEAILHALNRLAYGPRPGDVERVRQMGLAKWIEQQLNPNAIDDRAVEARLRKLDWSYARNNGRAMLRLRRSREICPTRGRRVRKAGRLRRSRRRAWRTRKA